MDVELVKCECCDLEEYCTQNYIHEVQSNFDGKWLCGLCSEAVRDELNRSSGKKKNGKQQIIDINEAVKAHKSFCGKFKSDPATLVADGMKQMLRRRSSGDYVTTNKNSCASSKSVKKYFSRSSVTSQVGV